MVATATATSLSLAAVGVLGASAAEAPTSTSTTPRTVSVQGVATIPIGQSANAAEATAVYRQAMTDALADGQSKAQFLASGAGAALGVVQSIVEDGGYITCTGNEVEYLGEQPDFGSPGVYVSAAGVSARSVVSPPISAPAVRGTAVKSRKRKRKPAAKSAAAGSCTLSAQVALVYALS
jgi:hypothetical protein